MGYFYGFHKGADPGGRHTHYVFEQGTSQPGLYAHLQGTPVESLGDPLLIAETITKSLGRPFAISEGWEHKTYSVTSIQAQEPLSEILRGWTALSREEAFGSDRMAGVGQEVGFKECSQMLIHQTARE